MVMRIGKTFLDTENMGIEEMEALIEELHRIRARKILARDFNMDFGRMLDNMSEAGFSFSNAQTGEVLRAQDWVIYDERDHVVHS